MVGPATTQVTDAGVAHLKSYGSMQAWNWGNPGYGRRSFLPQKTLAQLRRLSLILTKGRRSRVGTTQAIQIREPLLDINVSDSGLEEIKGLFNSKR